MFHLTRCHGAGDNCIFVRVDMFNSFVSGGCLFISKCELSGYLCD